MSALGICEAERCGGSLCMMGAKVCCERCGQPAPRYEAETAAAVAVLDRQRKNPPAPVVRKEDLSWTLGDRVKVLEDRLKAQASRIEQLEASVEELRAGGRRRHAAAPAPAVPAVPAT